MKDFVRVLDCIAMDSNDDDFKTALRFLILKKHRKAPDIVFEHIRNEKLKFRMYWKRMLNKNGFELRK